jgi:hypothetical protein
VTGTRAALAAFALLLVVAARASGQAAVSAQAPSPAADAATWSLSASAFLYVVPEDRNYVQPTFTADSDWLHLEVRYNYEDLETGSVWMGYNFAGGSAVAWEFTLMLGGVFGVTNGTAPGFRGALAWWKVDLYSEGEYVFDAGDSTDSYFYNWSELTLTPVDWLRVGLVTQRTRVYEMGRYIQRGPLVGITYKKLDVTAYLLDADSVKPTVVAAVAVDF